MHAEERFNELMTNPLPATKREALKFIGDLINLSDDLKREEGLCRALDLSREIEDRVRNSPYIVFLHYFRGNAFSALRKIRCPGRHQSLRWEIPEAEDEIRSFRMALSLAKEKELPTRLKCQILTNLGNVLDFIGRFVESIRYYDEALAIDSQFTMAMRNRGYATFFYAGVLYDSGHKAVFLKKAHEDLTTDLSGELEEGAGLFFKQCAERIASRVRPEFLTKPLSLRTQALGRSKSEIAYRRWCLSHRLFLNPLNDISKESIAARDVLHLPSIAVPLGDGMYYQGMFNQLKQEYASARFLLFEATHARKPHFSDRNTLLLNTLDYPCYGLTNEKLRLSFRMTFSILDKIAYFVNRYFDTAEDKRRIYFQSLWYMGRDRAKGLKTRFAQIQNWPLRGLFWLSKDVSGGQAWMGHLEPEAQNLADIRHHLEHKYLVLHDMMCSSKGPKSDSSGFKVIDPLVAHYSRNEMEAKSLKLLTLVRAALIYLSLSVRCEEMQRRKTLPEGSIVPSLAMDTYDDDWKR
jgi:tetratricopeptide (TPR) repeat protein